MSQQRYDGPHQVTPEAMARGNALLADVQRSRELALELGRQIEALDRLREDAWSNARAKGLEASQVLLGTTRSNPY